MTSKITNHAGTWSEKRRKKLLMSAVATSTLVRGSDSATIATGFEESGDGDFETTTESGILEKRLKNERDSIPNSNITVTTTDLYLIVPESTNTNVLNEMTTFEPVTEGHVGVNTTTDGTYHTTKSENIEATTTSRVFPTSKSPKSVEMSTSAIEDDEVTTSQSTTMVSSKEVTTSNMPTSAKASLVSSRTVESTLSTETRRTSDPTTSVPRESVYSSTLFSATEPRNLSTTTASTSFVGIPVLAANTTTLWLGTDQQTTIGGSRDADPNNIVPIVGVVCAVVGILLGIILTAGIWLYVSRRRLRQRRASAIEKNPQEKTFERLDFNLTLPRDHSSGNSSPSSYTKDPPDGSSYRHYEEPTPFVTDVYESGRPAHHSPPFHISNSNLNDLDEDHSFDGDAGNTKQLRDIGEMEIMYGSNHDIAAAGHIHYLPTMNTRGVSQPMGPARYGVPNIRTTSYSALLQDSSDQSTISRISSSAQGSENRRSSSCTYRTDLPDSDGSNSSTCGGSVSVTSSLAREKPYRVSSFRERGIDYLPPRLASEDGNTMSTIVASTFDSISGGKDDLSQSRGRNGDMSSISSASSLVGGHDNNTFDLDQDEEDAELNTTLKRDEEDSIESSLSYFDLHMPPSTFCSPYKASTLREEESETPDNFSFRRNSASSSVISDGVTLRSSNSENTINL